MQILVGYTGFVGSNIYDSGQFDFVYNSKNITEAFGKRPDLLVFAGIRAEKFLANKDSNKDMASINEAFYNIKMINPKKIVLISTIDVYSAPNNVDEMNSIDIDQLEPYGHNRLLLEQMVAERFENHLIIRLPGLFGKNIKKNFIYDMIHIIPNLITNEKYSELKDKSKLIANSYYNLDNGFYKCKILKAEQIDILKKEFMKAGFSALNFTDSRGIFQYYNLAYLYKDIMIALKNNIKLLNIATEPISIADLYSRVTGEPFINELARPIPNYNFKSIHYKYFHGNDGYLYCKEQILQDICEFFKGEVR